MTKPIALIAALGGNRAIGRGNALLWRLPGDLPRFKALTLGKPVVMGRKTFESIGRPLPGRTNIVLSRDADFAPDGVTVLHELQAAILMATAAEGNEIMIIGGGQLYAAALPLAQKMYLTEVDDAPEADTFFPAFDRTLWTETAREEVAGPPRFAYATYVRKPAF